MGDNELTLYRLLSPPIYHRLHTWHQDCVEYDRGLDGCLPKSSWRGLHRLLACHPCGWRSVPLAYCQAVREVRAAGLCVDPRIACSPRHAFQNIWRSDAVRTTTTASDMQCLGYGRGPMRPTSFQHCLSPPTAEHVALAASWYK